MNSRALTPIPVFLEILMALCLYNAFIQWPNLTHWVSIILGLFILLLITNGWFSLRATEPFYKYETVFVDLGAMFGYFNIFSSFVNPKNIDWGYDPSFFIYMALICGCYAGWDIIASRLNEGIGDAASARSLKKWANKMLITALVYLFEFGVLTWLVVKGIFERDVMKYIAWGLALFGVLLFSMWLYIWNAPKVQAWREGKLEL